MESKDHIPVWFKDQIRKAMDRVNEIMGKEEDLPLKEYHQFLLERIEVFATQVYSKAEEMYVRGLAERPNPENDGSKNTQPQKTHEVNVLHPTCATSTIEEPEEAGISICGPEITKEIATTEQQRLIAEEGAKMNEEMLPPNAVEPDSGMFLKNQTLDEEVFTPHEEQPDSDRSLKKRRYELVMRDDDPKLSSQMPD